MNEATVCPNCGKVAPYPNVYCKKCLQQMKELEAFKDTHVTYMSELVNQWLLKTGELLSELDVQTRRTTMDQLVQELKQRIHYL